MGTAWTYDSDPNDEHDAIREAAGLFDMSPLKKLHVRGPDAATVLNRVVTRDLSRVGAGRSDSVCPGVPGSPVAAGRRCTQTAGIKGQDPVETAEVHTRLGHQGSQPGDEVERLEDDVGGAIPVRRFEGVPIPGLRAKTDIRETL